MSNDLALKQEQQAAVRRQSEPVTPAQMLQIAVEQNADLDKLQQLMDLQDRWEANQARKAFVEAMSGFRGACPAIDRDRKGHNSNYATLAGTIEQIKALLSQHQLSHSWRTQQEGQMVTVTCTVTHSMGHSESTSLTAAPDTGPGKNSIQAIGSAVSYLQRYTLFAILGLASKDMDNDGAGAAKQEKFITSVQAKRLRDAAKFVGKDDSYICKKAQIGAVEDLHAARFEGALKHLQTLAEKSE